MKQLTAGVVLFSVLISCGGSEDDDFPDPGTSEFSQEDMAILSQTLNLDTVPYKYSNMDLPDHYTSEDANESDNTPDFNRITDMGATLGRVLFYDNNLSANNTISCASCHQQSAAFSDNDKFSKGLNGELTRRNSMGLYLHGSEDHLAPLPEFTDFRDKMDSLGNDWEYKIFEGVGHFFGDPAAQEEARVLTEKFLSERGFINRY